MQSERRARRVSGGRRRLERAVRLARRHAAHDAAAHRAQHDVAQPAVADDVRIDLSARAALRHRRSTHAVADAAAVVDDHRPARHRVGRARSRSRLRVWRAIRDLDRRWHRRVLLHMFRWVFAVREKDQRRQTREMIDNRNEMNTEVQFEKRYKAMQFISCPSWELAMKLAPEPTGMRGSRTRTRSPADAAL
jgi:hypothetical protein